MKPRFLLLPLFFVVLAAATPSSAADALTYNTAIQPLPREELWVKRHEGFVDIAKKGDVDILFMGDSITDGWRGRRGEKLWNEKYAPLKAANFGIGGDRTEHVLWRMKHGECDGIKPKVVVLLIGTNNIKLNSVEETVEGIAAVVKEFRKRLPESKILLLSLFPRSEKVNAPIRKAVRDINKQLVKLDDGKSVKFLDISDKFLDAKGHLSKDVMPDFLHPSAKGYKIWAEAMDPTLQSMLK